MYAKGQIRPATNYEKILLSEAGIKTSVAVPLSCLKGHKEIRHNRLILGLLRNGEPKPMSMSHSALTTLMAEDVASQCPGLQTLKEGVLVEAESILRALGDAEYAASMLGVHAQEV